VNVRVRIQNIPRVAPESLKRMMEPRGEAKHRFATSTRSVPTDLVRRWRGIANVLVSMRTRPGRTKVKGSTVEMVRLAVIITSRTPGNYRSRESNSAGQDLNRLEQILVIVLNSFVVTSPDDIDHSMYSLQVIKLRSQKGFVCVFEGASCGADGC
jgi:hypothetical protein